MKKEKAPTEKIKEETVGKGGKKTSGDTAQLI